MSQTTTHRTSSHSTQARLLNCVVEGVLAAGLGLAVLAALVLLLWISSPHAHGAPSDALRVAAGVWLLAHGAELVRVETLGGGTSPLAVTPLLLTALPALLLYRCVASLEEAAWRAATCVSGGYLCVAGLVVWYSMDSPFQAVLPSVAVRLPLLTFGCVALGAWARRGWPPPPRGALPLPGWLPWRRLFHALRVGVLSVVVMALGGALLATLSLVLNWSAASGAASQLTGAWSGRVALLLLCLALAPNAALWGAAYGLGPGFTVGVGNVVGPLVAQNPPQLPHFPLLAAVPAGTGREPWMYAALAALPMTAAVIAGLATARCCVPVRGSGHGAESTGGTVVTVLLVALGGGAGMAVLASLAGGPLGTGVLADFGPRGWLVGAAAAAWIFLGALPAALWARWWRLRHPQPLLAIAIGWRKLVGRLNDLRPSARRRPTGQADANALSQEEPGEGGDWHESRRSRWAALKNASGGLMPDLDDSGRARDDIQDEDPAAHGATEPLAPHRDPAGDREATRDTDRELTSRQAPPAPPDAVAPLGLRAGGPPPPAAPTFTAARTASPPAGGKQWDGDSGD